ncbi:hypothetical protein [Burkholderia dolosa]|uniref:hypothetical protein n=1 Tax=Burkholderia dolosa TaxID=152500 RepID=UPI001BA28B17|nr:hypothetical protein [Burkholderia dolosa]MBR8060352.1 hypothetical protein [Burkholderia dolosa]MBY4829257.1 hypothetical protein [Burkholderia dolosa]
MKARRLAVACRHRIATVGDARIKVLSGGLNDLKGEGAEPATDAGARDVARLADVEYADGGTRRLPSTTAARTGLCRRDSMRDTDERERGSRRGQPRAFCEVSLRGTADGRISPAR